MPEAVCGLVGIARTVAGEHLDGLRTAGRLHEAAGIGRNLTMPVPEHFDRISLTVRIHEGRRIRAGGPDAVPPEAGIDRDDAPESAP